MTVTTRADDQTILEMLDLRDNEGWTGTQIAALYGVTRNSVLGRLHRIDVACDPDAVCEGTMPRWWWV